MALLSLRDVYMNFGTAEILDGVSLQIEQGERVCLIGRNGEGKSTLMAIMNGTLEPVRGQVVRQPGLKIALLDQKVPRDIDGTVFDQIALGLGQRGQLLKTYHEVSRQVAAGGQAEILDKLDRIQHQVEAAGAWDVHQQVESVISHLKLDADAAVSTLSAGLKRRVLLAKALVVKPDILMLDEPTNHLEVESIVWLENFLERYPGTVVFVTHDRMFLQKLSTRILDIDRGRLTHWQCDYDTFVKRKQAQLDADASQNALFDKKLAQEEVWIRTGIKARRTRNEGRVRALLKLREQYRKRRNVLGKVKMQVHAAQLSGELVIEAKDASFAYQPKAEGQAAAKVIDGFSATIMRGDKIGVIGPNGSGKTTLLKMLLGQAEATEGSVRRGANLEIAYFDQLAAQLDEKKTVWENVADGYTTITINGQSRNVIGYLKDFLFTPEQARSPVANLSGGERNRLLLARVFAKPSNVLALDEPTNDLDMETLELLEELLIDYAGTVLLVSHDRAFLNNVVTGTFVFEGQGKVKEYAGGYDDWIRQTQEQSPPEDIAPETPKRQDSAPVSEKPAGKKKLSYKEQKEQEALLLKIEQLEQQQGLLHEQMAEPSFYKKGSDLIAHTAAEAQRLEEELKAAYTRWEQLEG